MLKRLYEFLIMQKQIELCEKQITYTLKISVRAKRLRLAIYRDGTFVVTAPKTMSEIAIERFVVQKSLWVIKKLEYFKRFSSVIFIKKSSKKGFTEHKEMALTLVRERIEYFNETYKFGFNKVSIKNQKTRWGSCSSKRNINFNYKIALLPTRLTDYIVVHELCHLGELNHSKKFWELVALTLPNHMELRKELKRVSVSSR